MESKMSKAKGDTKSYEGNLSNPIYSTYPSKPRRGPDRGAVSEGQRVTGTTGFRTLDVGQSVVGDPWVIGHEDLGCDGQGDLTEKGKGSIA